MRRGFLHLDPPGHSHSVCDTRNRRIVDHASGSTLHVSAGESPRRFHWAGPGDARLPCRAARGDSMWTDLGGQEAIRFQHPSWRDELAWTDSPRSWISPLVAWRQQHRKDRVSVRLILTSVHDLRYPQAYPPRCRHIKGGHHGSLQDIRPSCASLTQPSPRVVLQAVASRGHHHSTLSSATTPTHAP